MGCWIRRRGGASGVLRRHDPSESKVLAGRVREHRDGAQGQGYKQQQGWRHQPAACGAAGRRISSQAGAPAQAAAAVPRAPSMTSTVCCAMDSSSSVGMTSTCGELWGGCCLRWGEDRRAVGKSGGRCSGVCAHRAFRQRHSAALHAASPSRRSPAPPQPQRPPPQPAHLDLAVGRRDVHLHAARRLPVLGLVQLDLRGNGGGFGLGQLG